MLVAMQCAAVQVCSFSMTTQVRIFLTIHRSFPWLCTRMHLVYKGQRTSAEEGTKVLHAVENADPRIVTVWVRCEGRQARPSNHQAMQFFEQSQQQTRMSIHAVCLRFFVQGQSNDDMHGSAAVSVSIIASRVPNFIWAGIHLKLLCLMAKCAWQVKNAAHLHRLTLSTLIFAAPSLLHGATVTCAGCPWYSTLLGQSTEQ